MSFKDVFPTQIEFKGEMYVGEGPICGRMSVAGGHNFIIYERAGSFQKL